MKDNSEFNIDSLRKEDGMDAYKEACTTLRHYSSSSLQIRVITIVQGLALLIFWGASCKDGNMWLLTGIALMGCFLTLTLSSFHKGYFIATFFFYELVSSMEEKLFKEGFRPINSYNIEHKKRYTCKYAKYTVLYAPFVLIGISFLIILLVSIVKLIISLYCKC